MGNKQKPRTAASLNQMLEMRSGGLSNEQIGRAMGVSASQVTKAINTNRCPLKAAETKFKKYFGCDPEDVTGVTNDLKKKYTQQRVSAGGRGIPWEFSLKTWLNLWNASGHMHERGAAHKNGQGQGYCMARYGDVGPYSPRNVYICTNVENVEDMCVNLRGKHVKSI